MSVWVVVDIPGEENPITTRIQPVPQDVDDLKEAVKKEMAPDLDYCSAARLLIWHSLTDPSRRPDGPPLDPETALVVGPYYWVEAPAMPSAPGRCQLFSVSLSLCVCMCVCLCVVNGPFEACSP